MTSHTNEPPEPDHAPEPDPKDVPQPDEEEVRLPPREKKPPVKQHGLAGRQHRQGHVVSLSAYFSRRATTASTNKATTVLATAVASRP